MFRGFNLRLPEDALSPYYDDGKTIYSSGKTLIEKRLSEFSTSNGELNATKMQENWFPKTDAHVFISHSHKDEKLAVSFAGLLMREFGIDSFIDSCAWGYSSELLKFIDNEFCYNEDRETYSYEKRNASTSHVHMMLSTALNMMIDKTECIIFLNTPSSLTPKNTIDNSKGTTRSPWIYAEIAMTKLIRQRGRDEHRKILFKNAVTETIAKTRTLDFIQHELNVEHLAELSVADLIEWLKQFKSKELSKDPNRALDILYSLKS